VTLFAANSKLGTVCIGVTAEAFPGQSEVDFSGRKAALRKQLPCPDIFRPVALRAAQIPVFALQTKTRQTVIERLRFESDDGELPSEMLLVAVYARRVSEACMIAGSTIDPIPEVAVAGETLCIRDRLSECVTLRAVAHSLKRPVSR
jgi:hypothetical protein